MSRFCMLLCIPIVLGMVVFPEVAGSVMIMHMKVTAERDLSTGSVFRLQQASVNIAPTETSGPGIQLRRYFLQSLPPSLACAPR